jgi:hypothetical protein
MLLLLQTSAKGKASVKLLLLDTEDHEAAVIAEVRSCCLMHAATAAAAAKHLHTRTVCTVKPPALSCVT